GDGTDVQGHGGRRERVRLGPVRLWIRLWCARRCRQRLRLAGARVPAVRRIWNRRLRVLGRRLGRGDRRGGVDRGFLTRVGVWELAGVGGVGVGLSARSKVSRSGASLMNSTLTAVMTARAALMRNSVPVASP